MPSNDPLSTAPHGMDTHCPPSSCPPRTSECDHLGKQGLCRCNPEKMRTPWVRVGPECHDRCPYKKKRDTQTLGEKKPHEDESRDGGQSSKPGTQDAQSHRKLEEAEKHPNLEPLEGARRRCHLGFWLLAFRTRRKLTSGVFKPPNLWQFVATARGSYWSPSAGAAMTKYHTPGGLNSRCVISHGSGGREFKTKVPADSGSGESRLPVQRWLFSCYVLTWWRSSPTHVFSERPPSHSGGLLIPSPRPLLLTPPP